MNMTSQTFKTRMMAGPIAALILTIGMLLATPPMAKADTNIGNVMEKMMVDQTYVVDGLGNVAITFKMTFSARTWPFWVRNFGSNPALFKRNMMNYVGQLDTYDWNITHDDMNRMVTVALKAHGAVTYKGDGLFQYEVLKDWGTGIRNGNTYTFNFTNVENAESEAVNTIHVIMPDAATNIKEDFTGTPRTITYTLPIVSESHAGLMSGGIFLMILGIGSLVVGFVMPKKAVPARVAISAIQSRVLPPQTRNTLPPVNQPAPAQHNPAQHNPAAAQAPVQQAPPPGPRDFRPPVD
jgi:hypothetical protein